MNEREYSAGLSETPGYRFAERVGQQLFVAGQVPLDGNGCLIGSGDAGLQATQCLRNLKLLIELYDYTESDVRHLKVYVVGNRENLKLAWASVREWFDGCVPPATLIGVSLLGYEGQIVEVDATIVSEALSL